MSLYGLVVTIINRLTQMKFQYLIWIQYQSVALHMRWHPSGVTWWSMLSASLSFRFIFISLFGHSPHIYPRISSDYSTICGFSSVNTQIVGGAVLKLEFKHPGNFYVAKTPHYLSNTSICFPIGWYFMWY